MTTFKTFVIAACIAIGSVVPDITQAHSGGTDSAGCHYNHKTGGYHCH